jgi:hypothetical protein
VFSPGGVLRSLTIQYYPLRNVKGDIKGGFFSENRQVILEDDVTYIPDMKPGTRLLVESAPLQKVLSLY